jgi:lipopolysaccharide/colanic/teichoic acid biosynthesis glycosyltransferase
MAVLDQLRESRAGGRPCRPRPFGGALKRATDLALCVPILVLMGPLMFMVATAVKLQDGGPILFAQLRVGRDGRLFRCLKFRSMIIDAEARMQALLRDDPEAARQWGEKQKLLRDPRVTPVGRLLRATSADELPQLFNVLCGEMSLVGPRPILPNQIEAYGSGFPHYCSARPGITGLWQVSGRNETSFRQRSELDESYLRAWSLATDLSLLVRTAGVVAVGRGAC